MDDSGDVPSVNRREIADHLDGVFTTRPMSRQDLIAAAGEAGARSQVVAMLRTLPNGTFTRLRDLWPYLPKVPLDS